MKYYLIAGEASGDLHGANLMRGLLESDPAAEFRFWGGDRMAEVGGARNRVRDYLHLKSCHALKPTFPHGEFFLHCII